MSTMVYVWDESEVEKQCSTLASLQTLMNPLYPSDLSLSSYPNGFAVWNLAPGLLYS